MAHTTELPFYDVNHLYVITAGTHFKTQLTMTDLTSKADAMKPVGKYHRTDTIGISAFIDHHICIFGTRYRCKKKSK